MRCPRRLPKGVRAAAQLYSLQPIRRAGPGSPAECGHRRATTASGRAGIRVASFAWVVEPRHTFQRLDRPQP
jgi:hypothetical protein